MTNFIDGMLILWLILTAGSMLFLIYDLFTNTPTTKLMKLAWILVVLYTGPIGLLIYLLSCRQPLPGMHDAFIDVHWKQAVGSLLHCVAGDATGIIFSAVVVYHFGLANGVDLTIEYISAFIVGLFIFQALFMLRMYDGNYWMAVRKTFFAETVSMNMVMLGMIPTMVILMHSLPGANNPNHLLFWGVMSLAAIAGMITAYPINSWLVAKGLKHGMMSAIPAPESTEKMDGQMNMEEAMDTDKEMNMDMPSSMKEGKHTAGLPLWQSLSILLGSFLLLFVSLWVTNLFVPIRFFS